MIGKKLKESRRRANHRVPKRKKPPEGTEGFKGQSSTFRMAAIPKRHEARLIVMVTRIVVLFHIGIALDPVATEPEGFVFASGRVDKPPLPDVSARLWLSAQLLVALFGTRVLRSGSCL